MRACVWVEKREREGAREPVHEELLEEPKQRNYLPRGNVLILPPLSPARARATSDSAVGSEFIFHSSDPDSPPRSPAVSSGVSRGSSPLPDGFGI